MGKRLLQVYDELERSFLDFAFVSTYEKSSSIETLSCMITGGLLGMPSFHLSLVSFVIAFVTINVYQIILIIKDVG
jgi:hypothetical protein